MSKARMDRRNFLAGGSMMLAACGSANGEYFGRTTPPSAATLVHSLLAEPATLDPARSPGDIESYVVPALFEGLTSYHPFGPEPMAALATRYEVSAAQDCFTFYLRGHPAPRGTKLPDSDSLPAEFTGGQMATPVRARQTGAMDDQLLRTILCIRGAE